MPKKLQVGDVAPDFTLPSSTGQTIHLYEVLERSEVVLFFYPKAFTPVCTAEVCGFRDAFPQFESKHVEVMGISSDSPDTAVRFGRQHALQFPLLSDGDSTVRLAYAVPKLFGVLPGRVTYVIGRDRKIKQITVAGFRTEVHVLESLKHANEVPAEK